MNEISVDEANKRLSDDDFVVIDVREQYEIDAAAIGNFVHIPMMEIPARIGEIPKDKTIAFLCHTGARSGRVTMYLMQNGFNNVVNVLGGIDAWARTADNNVPRYTKAFGRAQVIS